ncbi:MAG: VOC family protein [Nitrospirales bacterium]|nr:VOC family protein [Nitrospira sp.]MDR4461902.1 VOC family protein [Nitrospirales bacterium]MDR4483889.1 VOC family protein [Nitrospirales bacterium]
MSIELNHTIVPAHDKVASAKFYAKIFGLMFDEGKVGYFAPLRINETLTFDFDDDEVDTFDIHHYAFKVGEEDFDRIFGRIQAEGIPYGSEPTARENMTINHRGGGRGVYFCDQNGHILELLTVG